MWRHSAALLVAAFGVSIASMRAAQDPAIDPATLPDGPGKTILFRVCSDCHGIPQVIAKRRSFKQWRDLTLDMVARGNPVEDADVDRLIEYCALHVGYVNVNKASEADLVKYGGFAPAEAAAIVAARAAGTLFESMDQLKALPGIDAKGLDARQDRIAFKDR